MYQLPPIPPAIRPLTNAQSEWVAKMYPDAVDSPTRCITCTGRKTFRWYAYASYPQPEQDRRDVVEFQCNCAEQYLVYRRLLYCGIGTSYQRLSWDDFFKLSEEHLRAADDYLEHLEQYIGAGLGLVLYGPDLGTGKTMFGLLLAKQIVSRGRDFYATTFSGFLDNYTGGFRDKEQASLFAYRVRNAGNLFVDDVGREYGGRHEMAASALEDVVRHRSQHCLPSHLSTNLTPDKLQASYGPHTRSVLQERTIYVPFAGVDRREQYRIRMIDEIRAGLTRPIVIV
jgi:DNA replication protein DnaC